MRYQMSRSTDEYLTGYENNFLDIKDVQLEHLPSEEAMRNYLEKMVAARDGGPTSTVAGDFFINILARAYVAGWHREVLDMREHFGTLHSRSPRNIDCDFEALDSAVGYFVRKLENELDPDYELFLKLQKKFSR